MYVVEHYWHAVAWRFSQTHIPGNDAFKHLGAEEASKIGSNLLGKRGSVVVHGQKDALDCEGRVDSAAEAHERVEELRDAFESQVLALDRHQN